MIINKFQSSCDLIPYCSDCKLEFEDCNVDIPEYIPDEQINKFVIDFRNKYMKN